ncbi:rRNA pseudouridine synthase [bacterium]|nr:rRNA pseudouridine synthase [bacterium]
MKNRRTEKPHRQRPRSAKHKAANSTEGKRPFEHNLDLTEPVRLNRFIARSGVCSRREADTMIEKGLVSINGVAVTELGTKVSHGDSVQVNGKRIVPTDKQYVLLNKPTDTITTTSDDKGRTSVMDLVEFEQNGMKGMFPVGRLDRHTTGVLILTNDGMLAHRLTHPSFLIDKDYLVETTEVVSEENMNKLMTGIELEDGLVKADRVERVDPRIGNLFLVRIHEGKNRQVRRMFESLGAEVKKLERTTYAGLTAKGVRRGKWRRLTRDEVTGLYRKVKL